MSTLFSCTVNTTDNSAPLGLEIWFDDQRITDQDHVTGPESISYEFEDEGGVHQLRFVMKNKTNAHTKIDSDGNIMADACITIDDVGFDDIRLGHVFVENTQYSHDFNGTQDEITEPFYGVMGCNGTVTFEFESPFYLWLLEHLQP